MLYLAIEEGLGKKLTDDESEKFKSVRDMVDALNSCG
jgi:acyl carrier protein